MPWNDKKAKVLIFGFMALVMFMDAAVQLISYMQSASRTPTDTSMTLFLVVLNGAGAVIMGYGALMMDKEESQ